MKYKLGELLALSEAKNTDGVYTIDDVKGISIQKVFIDTKADMVGVSLKPYLIVQPDDFAYVTITSRNGEKITLAHNHSEENYIVSSSYVVFRVSKPEILNSDYLFMYFNRPEFDRYARFNSWGSAREAFSWDDMCDTTIDLPPLHIQKKYADVLKAMSCSQAYREHIKNICPILIKGSLEEAMRGG
jgi:type I restriction enzyme S subunit